MTETHYISAYARQNGHGKEMAVCGAYVTHALHSDTPSCPECRELIADDDETDRKLTELLKTPCENPVKVEHFDTTRGYTPRQR